MAVKEALSDRNGKFRIPKKISFSIPILSQVVENRPIAFKPGYKFLILDNKVSEVRLEKVPTLLTIRKEEFDKVYENNEPDVHETTVLLALIRREQEFIESHRPVKRLRTSRRSRVSARKGRVRDVSSPTVEPQTRIKDPETVEHLINQLMSEDRNVRRRAADALGRMDIQSPKNIESLRAAVRAHLMSGEDGNKDLKSIAKIGAPVVPILLDELKHGSSDVKRKAIRVIWAIRDPEAVPPLIIALDSDDSTVRGVAASALGRIRDPAAVEPLVNTLRKHADNRYSAEQALMKIGAPAVGHLIYALSDEDWDVRKRAAYILGIINDDRAVEGLIAASRDKESRVRRSVAFALGELRDSRAVEPLIVALEDGDFEVRTRAADALGKIQDPASIEPLLAALKDPSWRVRKSVVEALATMYTERVIKALIQVWNDEHEEVRLRAAEILVQIGSSAVEPLIATLGHEDSYFRWRAAWALGKIKNPKALNQLTPLLNDNVSEVRWITVAALGELRDPRAVEPLISILNDGDLGIRRKARQSLVRTTGKESMESLPKDIPGVFYPGFSSEYRFLSNPRDIDVDDEDNVYIADGFFRTIYKISKNGELLKKTRDYSGGSIDIEIDKENDLYVFKRDTLLRTNKLSLRSARVTPKKGMNNPFPFGDVRFTVGRRNDLFLITEPLFLKKHNPFIYHYSFEGDLICKYEVSPKNTYPGEINIQLIDLTSDAEGDIYVVHSYVNPYWDEGQKKYAYRNGILKFGKNLRQIFNKKLDLDGKVRGITITKNGDVIIADNRAFYVFEKNMNLKYKENLSSEELGKVDIARIKTDRRGDNLYLIESHYGRILKYDLRNKELCP